MKRILLMAGVVAVIALSACNKEKDCECTTSFSGTGSDMMPDQKASTTTKEECSDANTEATVAGMTTKVTCVEK